MKNPIQIFKKLFTINDTPELVAKGFAMGSFIGMIPIPGFQVFVAYFLASVFKINKSAACIAVFNTNLLTGPFIFAFNYWLGKTILGISSSFVIPQKIELSFITTIISSGADVYLSLIVGGLITGIFTALISYPLIKRYTIYRQSHTKQ
ncbi:DUF2062 domain-containing protein [Aquimarina rhabdastrellae]